MSVLINRKLGMNRGTERIFLDGELIECFGVIADKYDRIWEADKLILTASDNGKYKISSKKKGESRLPVIDITTSKLAELFDQNQKLRIAIKTGKIVIEAHHEKGMIEAREERFLHKLRTGQPLKVGSMYHGGGVLSSAVHQGLADAGVKSVVSFAVEWEQKFLRSSMRNNKHIFDRNTVFINSDITDLKYHQSQVVDIIEAGIPCTGASKSGKSSNKIKFAEEHESAGALFFATLNIIQSSNSSLVLLENVAPYLSTASFAVIKSVLSKLGYVLYTTVLRGDHFGASERRERMVCLAISKGLVNEGIIKAIEAEINCHKTEPVPLKHIVEDLPDDHPSWSKVEYLHKKQEKDIAAGKGFRMSIHTKDDVTCNVITSGYAKVRSTDPRWQHPTKPEYSRLFTPTEHAIIKGIRPELVDGLSATVAHQILGNSVCFNQFRSVANAMISVLKMAHCHTTSQMVA